MIAKMKKLTFLIYYKEYEDFLKKIQELGVLHVQTTQEGSVVPTSELDAKMKFTAHVAELKTQLEAFGEEETTGNPTDAADLVTRIDKLNDSLHKCGMELQRLRKDEAALLPWGQFDPKRVKGLSDIGYVMNFFVCPQRMFKTDWEAQYNATVITTDKGKVYFITVTPTGEELTLEAEQIRLPQCSLHEVQESIKMQEQQTDGLENRLKELARTHLSDLRAYESELRSSIVFDKVMLGTAHAADDRLMVLQGWIPTDKETEVKKLLDREGVYYEIRAARKEDKAPVKLTNNALVRMYEVLTRMYGVPGTTDSDPTSILSIFFTLFFAMCVADAGYGVLLVLLSLLDIKTKGKVGKVLFGINFNLVLVLGIACIVVGIIFGTAFGVDLSQLTFVPDWMKACMITGKIPGTNYDKLMLLALLIGVVHISLAMTIKTINATLFNGFKESLGVWGWWLAVVGSAVVGALSFTGVIPAANMMTAFYGVWGVSAIGIYLLNDIHRNPVINILAGLYDTYNMASGLMGDILSYIRLYALGLAGGILGATFNTLALMVTGDDLAHASVGGWIGFLLILVFGHILNIAMSCLSAFVHPLRLSFVEYFKNAGYEGNGEEYKPFSKVELTSNNQ